ADDEGSLAEAGNILQDAPQISRFHFLRSRSLIASVRHEKISRFFWLGYNLNFVMVNFALRCATRTNSLWSLNRRKQIFNPRRNSRCGSSTGPNASILSRDSSQLRLLCSLFFLLCICVGRATPPVFEKDIRPILKAHCF